MGQEILKQNEPSLQSLFNLDKATYAWKCAWKHRLPGVSGSPLRSLLSPPPTERWESCSYFQAFTLGLLMRMQDALDCASFIVQKYLPVQPAVPHTDSSSLQGERFQISRYPQTGIGKSHPRHLAEQFNAVWPSLTCKKDFDIMWSTLVPGITGLLFWNPGLHVYAGCLLPWSPFRVPWIFSLHVCALH